MTQTSHEKIALVTGANKGIGREIAAQLAALEMTVLVGSRDSRRGEEATASLRPGGDLRAITIDVTDPATIGAAAKYIEERFGRLDVLVNNAGITGPRGLRDADLASVRRVFETNVLGVITVTNAMLPLLMRSRQARIVNLSSSVGSLARVGDPGSPYFQIPPSAAYGPSKAALNALTVQYAKELRENDILVNAADPGGAATDMTRAFGYTLERSAAQAAKVVVRLATLGPNGPTGGFFDEDGPVPW
jgi:NAD(P)-dependent dehydrogenase (short-subunit alcohol dehydrogenase family)